MLDNMVKSDCKNDASMAIFFLMMTNYFVIWVDILITNLL